MAAWELRRGLRPLGLYTGAIVAGALLVGLFVAPFRVMRAWRSSNSGQKSLFHDRERSCDTLVALSTGALRESLNVPAHGQANGRRGVHSVAPDP